MPKGTDITSVLVIGSGPIIIGQACEFDYSSTQACRALREEGIRVVLVNSNPATIMTDPELADATYIEPLTPAYLEAIIIAERPDALLPTMGGQTALNLSLALEKSGVLARAGCRLIGAQARSITLAEDRYCFRQAMERIGLPVLRAQIATDSASAERALSAIGLPAVLRPSFTLGGRGGGIATTDADYKRMIAEALRISPQAQVLVEESVLGWKEYELEVVRDHADNCIIVCAIENIDPMGIHTGDSITVAPTLTLTDKEYQRLRDAAIACLRCVGVDTGGANVQFAVDPSSGRSVIIEMNPRVSRSSALASKATGFPIARIATKLALGYRLDELRNEITGGAIPASFEPTLDYVVVKLPRFAFEKFRQTPPLLSTTMHAVGEVMAIGCCFAEALHKGLRGLETGLSGLDDVPDLDLETLRHQLTEPRAERILLVAQGLRQGLDAAEIAQLTGIDPWYIAQIAGLVDQEEEIRRHGLPEDAASWLRLKQQGFSDIRLAHLGASSQEAVRSKRAELKIHPLFRRIDSCAGEFPAATPYLYSSYHGAAEPSHCEAQAQDRRKAIVLGSGPNRIGQGIEFDYCCVHAVQGLQQEGLESIMINCNPETVSTDYDCADRLYFEPLQAEDVLEVIRVEQARGDLAGVLLQFGGQTPLKLASDLEKAGIPILGTAPAMIDLAEDRGRFQSLLSRLGLQQPESGLARTPQQAAVIAQRIGYPLLARPSYVLGGQAMKLLPDAAALKGYMDEARLQPHTLPILLDRYLRDAIEVDVDLLCDGQDVCVAGVMEHVEEAGVHSGDSACVLPARHLTTEQVGRISAISRKLALELKVLGLMNAQFAIQGDEIFVLEVNPRASRTVPFVAKATGLAIARLAARLAVGARLSALGVTAPTTPAMVAVKEAVFPFDRFPEEPIDLSPEMRSTGEVMGLARDFAGAFFKAQQAAGFALPAAGTALLWTADLEPSMAIARDLLRLGFTLCCPPRIVRHLAERGMCARAPCVRDEDFAEAVSASTDIKLAIIIAGAVTATIIAEAPDKAEALALRRHLFAHLVPTATTLAGARALCLALDGMQDAKLEVCSLQAYLSRGAF